MALIVEDGTIVAGAESYCTVAFADAYHTARGNTSWTGSDAVKEAALRKATDYTVQVYRDLWQGYRVDEDQVLDWPRSMVAVDTFAVDYLTIPTDIKNATAELALRALSAELTVDVSQQKRRVKIGQIETEYDTSSGQQKRYSRVTGMLAPYLMYSPGTVRAVRA